GAPPRSRRRAPPPARRSSCEVASSSEPPLASGCGGALGALALQVGDLLLDHGDLRLVAVRLHERQPVLELGEPCHQELPTLERGDFLRARLRRADLRWPD